MTSHLFLKIYGGVLLTRDTNRYPECTPFCIIRSSIHLVKTHESTRNNDHHACDRGPSQPTLLQSLLFSTGSGQVEQQKDLTNSGPHLAPIQHHYQPPPPFLDREAVPKLLAPRCDVFMDRAILYGVQHWYQFKMLVPLEDNASPIRHHLCEDTYTRSVLGDTALTKSAVANGTTSPCLGEAPRVSMLNRHTSSGYIAPSWHPLHV